MSRGKSRQRWHCRACTKTAFGSQKRAEDTMNLIGEQHSADDVVPTRAYPCPYGNGWHLTKQEVKS